MEVCNYVDEGRYNVCINEQLTYIHAVHNKWSTLTTLVQHWSTVCNFTDPLQFIRS